MKRTDPSMKSYLLRLTQQEVEAQFAPQRKVDVLRVQGERILIGLTLWQTCSEELDQVGLIPSRELSFSVDASLARAFALGEVHRDFAKECDVLGAVVGSDS